jgi:hypothetical protein
MRGHRTMTSDLWKTYSGENKNRPGDSLLAEFCANFFCKLGYFFFLCGRAVTTPPLRLHTNACCFVRSRFQTRHFANFHTNKNSVFYLQPNILVLLKGILYCFLIWVRKRKMWLHWTSDTTANSYFHIFKDLKWHAQYYLRAMNQIKREYYGNCPDDASCKYLLNVGQLLPDYTANNPEDSLLHTRRRENLKSHTVCAYRYTSVTLDVVCCVSYSI